VETRVESSLAADFTTPRGEIPMPDRPMAAGWTVASVLGHVAFWDQRIIALIDARRVARDRRVGDGDPGP
jgi:hypothetical protein